VALSASVMASEVGASPGIGGKSVTGPPPPPEGRTSDAAIEGAGGPGWRCGDGAGTGAAVSAGRDPMTHDSIDDGDAG
jgi:hypothetical protein